MRVIIILLFLFIFFPGYSQNSLQGIFRTNDVQYIGLNYQDRSEWISFNMTGIADSKANLYFEVKMLLHKDIGNWNIAFTPVPMLSIRWGPDPETRIYAAKKRTPIEFQVSRKLFDKFDLGINYRLFDLPELSVAYKF